MSHPAEMDTVGCDEISSRAVFCHAFANAGGGFGKMFPVSWLQKIF